MKTPNPTSNGRAASVVPSQMRFVDTFGKHRNEPGKSLDAYLRERRLALGKSIADRHKVYLDTKYWLLLRDHRLGRSEDPVIARLSFLLEDGAQSAKLICPMSADIFLEILKQTDPVTPEQKKFGPDGTELASEWEKLTSGQSRYNVLTFEMRGKSVLELGKSFIKRSLEEGKLQDLLPWGKG